MSTILLILPNQLFVSKQEVAKHRFVYLLEEPIFFYDAKYKPFKPNKVKLAFLRACMKAYHKSVSTPKTPIQYIDYNDFDKFVRSISSHSKVVMYDPIDNDVVSKYNKLFKDLILLPSPDLIIPKQKLDKEYFQKHSKTQRHASFYEFIKKELNILNGVKNLDKENRSPPPKLEPHIYNFRPSVSTLPYYNEAIDYVNKHFHDHIGNTENVKLYPITYKDANKQFTFFLNNSLPNFGRYEDAVMKDDAFMYHSIMSPLLNVGLLNPTNIIHLTIEFYKSSKLKIPLSSLEGFIRQVVGWRCMMQAMYIFKADDLLKSNAPNNIYTFRDWQPWLKGETGILPLDEEIKKACKYGYSHHIVRLMIFLNFFILCELHPDVIYKWFMEVVSIDAYSWVMISNIYAMGYFYPKMMTKPYLSTSNYIIKMTTYKKDGHWDKVWDALYHDFLRTKPNTYTFFYKRTFKNDNSLQQIARDFKAKHFMLYKRQ
jgi:deoxyribodipyrimidine photolyase-related protein